LNERAYLIKERVIFMKISLQTLKGKAIYWLQ